MCGQRASSDLRAELRGLLRELAGKYHVESIAMFGSRVRGDARPESDLDLLVVFSEPPGLLKFLEMESFLADKLGVDVDLVMKSALKPRIAERILGEAEPV